MENKTCCTCKETLPLSAFAKNSYDKSGYRGTCKNCRNTKRSGKTSKRKHRSVYYKSPNITEKECSECHGVKPVSEFQQWEVECLHTNYMRYGRVCNSCKASKPEKEVTLEAIVEKKCGSCGLAKPTTEYSRCKTSISGLQSRCKECVRVETKSNLEINYAHFYYPVNDF